MIWWSKTHLSIFCIWILAPVSGAPTWTLSVFCSFCFHTILNFKWSFHPPPCLLISFGRHCIHPLTISHSVALHLSPTISFHSLVSFFLGSGLADGTWWQERLTLWKCVTSQSFNPSSSGSSLLFFLLLISLSSSLCPPLPCSLPLAHLLSHFHHHFFLLHVLPPPPLHCSLLLHLYPPFLFLPLCQPPSLFFSLLPLSLCVSDGGVFL